MATGSVWLQYRPVRFGLCVRQGNLQDVRQVLRLTHTLWGGRYNPIIPVTEGNLGHRLVDLYRVDVLYPAIADDALLNGFIDRFPYLPWPDLQKAFFIRGNQGRGIPKFLDLYHPVRKIFEEHIKDKLEPKVNATVFEWDPADPLADALLALFGGYPTADEIAIDYAEFVVRNLKGVRVAIGQADIVPAD